MDWSPDRVLSFGPVTHRRGLRWQQRRNLLWPVHAWRVVTPEPRDQPLNVLQRAVLRFQLTGVREPVKIGALLGVDSELVAFVARELVQMDLVGASGSVTDRGRRMLEDTELDVGAMRVGWVFQDTWDGRLWPRFVANLEHADVEADDEGRAWVRSGSKGAGRKDPAFVVRAGNAAVTPPQPIDVLEAAYRHRRHERRARRAGLDLDGIRAETAHQVSLISDQPELVHLVTFAYVPETIEDEDEPWYVADPFGFGASMMLREHLEWLRTRADGGLREVLDRMTGEHAARQRDAWLSMQELIRDEAGHRVTDCWPVGTSADDERVRERLVLAFEEIVRFEHEEGGRRDLRGRFDAAYLKLRQALEIALQRLRDEHAPGDAWRRLYQGERWVPRDSSRQAIRACIAACGFDVPRESALLEANPGKVRATCLRSDSTNLRPLCVAMVLAATDDDTHPLRRLSRVSPSWLSEVNRIAEAAGAEVHGAHEDRTLDGLRRDAHIVIDLCEQLLSVLATGARGPTGSGRT